jgi:dienelactone hydrolase
MLRLHEARSTSVGAIPRVQRLRRRFNSRTRRRIDTSGYKAAVVQRACQVVSGQLSAGLRQFNDVLIEPERARYFSWLGYLPRKRSRAVVLVLAGAALIAIGLRASNGPFVGKIAVSDHWLHTADGTSIYARLYVPVPPPSVPVPGVVVAHGYMANLGMVELPLVVPLVRQGLVVLSLDRLGHGRSGGELWPRPPRVSRLQDFDPGLQRAIRYLRSQPFVDGSRIGLIGHSDGSRAVIMAACADWSIAAAVAISSTLHPVDWVNDVVPKDLLLIYGTDERFVTPADEETLFMRATDGHRPDPGVLLGNLTAGDAREMLLVPGVGHVSALYSERVVERALQWLDQALTVQHPGKYRPMVPAFRGLAISLAGWLLFGTGLLVLLRGQRQDAMHAGSVRVSVPVFWGIYRVGLFLAAVACGTRVAKLIDPILRWVPLEGAHWFVALPIGLCGALCVTAPLGLLPPSSWRAVRERWAWLTWSRCLRGAAGGIFVAVTLLAALGVALTGWYEAVPAPAKLLAFAICLPAFFIAALSLELWTRQILPAGLGSLSSSSLPQPHSGKPACPRGPVLCTFHSISRRRNWPSPRCSSRFRHWSNAR